VRPYFPAAKIGAYADSPSALLRDSRDDMLLVTYASKHGATREIAAEIAKVFRERGIATDLRSALEVDDVEPYDSIVLGAAIYVGRLHFDAIRFLERHRRELRSRAVAVYGVGPRDLEPDSVLHSRFQLLEELRGFRELDPVAVTVFGGVIHPEELRWPFSRMQPSDARDWDAIRVWAAELAQEFGVRHDGAQTQKEASCSTR
jgi:menaquinone-dependent protoporphyrinogen oxidase